MEKKSAAVSAVAPPLLPAIQQAWKTEEEGSRLGPISLHSHFARLCLREVSLCPLFHWA